jgi:hypothetical protein
LLLWPYLEVREHVTHPYKTTGKLLLYVSSSSLFYKMYGMARVLEWNFNVSRI